MVGKREQNRSEQRARILDAAHGLFSEHGFDDVKIADIATEAGVARATVFNHFGSKRALVEAITDDVMSSYAAMLERALADDHTPVPDLIRALFEQMGAGIELDRRFYRGVFREISNLALGFDAGEAELRHELALRLELLRKGQERGELSRDHRAEDMGAAFDSLVNGTITGWLYGDPGESLRARMRRVAEIFLGAVEAGERRKARVLPMLGAQRKRRHA